MREHKQKRILITLLLGLVLFALCLPVNVIAEAKEYSDGQDSGISLSTVVPPAVKSGSGAEYRKGSTEGLTFTTDDTANNFVRVLIDETEIPSDSYTVSGELLTVILHMDYLDTLSTGEHKIEIITVNGSAVADFTVISRTNQETSGARNDSPNTGDSGNVLLSTVPIVMCSALLIIALSVRTKRRKNEK